jgi:hypothetical protein
MAIVRLEGLGKLKKKFSDLIGTKTHGLPTCSILSEPTTLPSAPMTSLTFTIQLFHHQWCEHARIAM